jgi:DNA-directed RNA polymerase subunit H (RpoH/RPB5)
VNSTVNNATNIRIECSKPDKQLLTVIIVLNYDGAVKKSAEMEKLIDSIPHDGIIVVPMAVTSSVQRKIELLLSKRPDDHLFIHHYRMFSIVMPDRERAYPHRIMSKEEVDTLLSYDLYKSVNDIPSIKVLDPQAVWICARVGDVIHIKRSSETAVYEDGYRRVMPGDVLQ